MEPLLGNACGGVTQGEYTMFGMQEEQRDKALIFSEGEQDAVTITMADMQSLQPGRSLSGNVIDFCNKYLLFRLCPTMKEGIHIFNTSFFTKLVQIGDLPDEQRDAAYQRVQRWAGNVNLFNKKFVFVPVYQSSHWSLIIICNLSSVTNAPENQECRPHILHLDSGEGKLENLEGHIIEYIYCAYLLERHQNLAVNQLVALREMNYVELEVPQQENQYDCGIYLLCFIELFLRASLNVDSVPNQESLFTSLEGTYEVSAKRRYIKDLILELTLEYRRKSLERKTGLSELYDGRPVSQIPDVLETNLDETDVFVSEGRTEDRQMDDLEQVNIEVEETEFQHHQISVEVASDNQQHTKTDCSEHPSPDEGILDFQQLQQLECAPLKPGKERRKRRVWSDEETRILLTCMKEGGRFSKGGQATTNWIAVSQEIAQQLRGSESLPTADQCRFRYDTLLKAYNKTKEELSMGKRFSDLKHRELKLATRLTEDWYNAIDEIFQRSPHKARSAKQNPYRPIESLPILEELIPTEGPQSTLADANSWMLRNLDQPMRCKVEAPADVLLSSDFLLTCKECTFVSLEQRAASKDLERANFLESLSIC